MVFREERHSQKRRDGCRELRAINIYDGKQVGEIYECRDGDFRVAINDSYDRLCHVGTRNNVFEAKKLAEKAYKEEQSKRRAPCNLLPANEELQFYPTPAAIVGKMLSGINWKDVSSVLEPSAGKGDILEGLARFIDKTRKCCRIDVKKDVDVIELDPNLQFVLRGKGYRLIDDDFLRHNARKRYDVILMNPPFFEGEKHLLKAIMLQENGGQICCILNAETIRNPYTNSRKLLLQKLSEYGARVEFVRDAFKRSEHPTDVEIAIITISIPRVVRPSKIFEDLKRAQRYEADNFGPSALAVKEDWIHELLTGYRIECDGGVTFLQEYVRIAPYIRVTDKSDATPHIKLQIGSHSVWGGDINETKLINDYLDSVRYKYWRLFMYNDRLQEKTGAMPSAMLEDYRDKLDKMASYEFDEFNIRQFIYDIQLQLNAGMEQAILDLFQKLSAEHSYLPETGKNRWYYTGWKTNKAHKVGKKVIIPVNGAYADSWCGEMLDSYRIFNIMCDLVKVMDYLDRGETAYHTNIELEVRRANRCGKAEIDCTYFTARFYKKGTCHIRFKDEAQHILDRLNIFAGSKYNWLPPTYGKVRYSDMTAEERAVIDEFQGEKEYDKVYAAPDNFIIATSSQPLLL